jgi:hypothetical protein
LGALSWYGRQRLGTGRWAFWCVPTETPLSEASSIAGVPGGGTLSGCSLETGRVGKEEHVGVENGSDARGAGRASGERGAAAGTACDLRVPARTRNVRGRGRGAAHFGDRYRAARGGSRLPDQRRPVYLRGGNLDPGGRFVEGGDTTSDRSGGNPRSGDTDGPDRPVWGGYPPSTAR